MNHLTPDDLYSLEEYAKIRGDFRAKVMTHKRERKVPVGPHATLYFEDRLTIQYQIQEMLRVERIFEPEGIADELGAYNPLIPDGSNWKATFMVEYSDPDERRAALAELVGIEESVWVQVGELEKVFAIADEDLERSDETKTSSVHFMRFELNPDMVGELKRGQTLSVGSDHANYRHAKAVAQATRESLLQDLQ